MRKCAARRRPGGIAQLGPGIGEVPEGPPVVGDAVVDAVGDVGAQTALHQVDQVAVAQPGSQEPRIGGGIIVPAHRADPETDRFHSPAGAVVAGQNLAEGLADAVVAVGAHGVVHRNGNRFRLRMEMQVGREALVGAGDVVRAGEDHPLDSRHPGGLVEVAGSLDVHAQHGLPGGIDGDLGRQVNDVSDRRQPVEDLRHLPGVGDVGLQHSVGKWRREIQPVDIEGIPQGVSQDPSDETVDAGDEQFGLGHGETKGL